MSAVASRPTPTKTASCRNAGKEDRASMKNELAVTKALNQIPRLSVLHTLVSWRCDDAPWW